MSLVEVDGLRIELEPSGSDIVDSVSFRIEEGEVLALVGESGSGKTTIGCALLGYARRGARITAGTVRVAGKDIVPEPPGGLRNVRGSVVAYIPQDPAVALNPALRIGMQINETLLAHRVCNSDDERAERVRSVLAEVRLPSDKGFLSRFPHQLSGGQQQRVCIAIATCCQPRLLVMDEPTTGLDVSTQAHVLHTLANFVEAHGMAALYVSHDLSVVANVADRVMVLYSGHVAEYGQRARVFARPGHPYTAGLLGAVPDIQQRSLLTIVPGRAPSLADRPTTGCRFAPRCEWVLPECLDRTPDLRSIEEDHESGCVRAMEVMQERQPRPNVTRTRPLGSELAILQVRDLEARFGSTVAVRGVSLELAAGECLALVGESGSGKTTLARSIVGLNPTRGGEVEFQGALMPVSCREYPRNAHQKLQYIFQSPYNSLNPRRTIGSTLTTPLRCFYHFDRKNQQRRIDEALERVSLSPQMKPLYPDQLSGGERQRVAIARALLCEPDILLCDEITSALDVSVQAAIVDLLADLQRTEGMGLLFVTHNMGLVRAIADRVIVMRSGEIVEGGAAEDVLVAPKHEYTKLLLRDTPSLLPRTSERETAPTLPLASDQL